MTLANELNKRANETSKQKQSPGLSAAQYHALAARAPVGQMPGCLGAKRCLGMAVTGAISAPPEEKGRGAKEEEEKEEEYKKKKLKKKKKKRNKQKKKETNRLGMLVLFRLFFLGSYR